jgi:NitT/TauT family transport system substrate-binding protein
MPIVGSRGAAGLLVALLALTACAAPPTAAPAAPGGGAPAPQAAAPPQAPAAGAEPVKIRLAALNGSSNVPFRLADERGYFRQEGLDVEFTYFASNSEMIPALATGQLEMVPMPSNPATWNAIARATPVKLVLDVITYRPGGLSDQTLAIRKSVLDAGRWHGLEDLRGLSLAITPPGKGTASACALSVGLQRVGMTLDDLDIQPLPFPEMTAAIANGAIEAGVMAEPFITRAEQQGMAQRVLGLGDMYPNFTISTVGFAIPLYENRPPAKGFVRAYLRAVREYRAAVNGQSGDAAREAMYDLIARGTGMDIATVREITLPYMNPNGLPNREAVLFCYGFFRDQGLIPQPVPEATMQTLWGTDLVDEVLAEIGRVPEN